MENDLAWAPGNPGARSSLPVCLVGTLALRALLALREAISAWEGPGAIFLKRVNLGATNEPEPLAGLGR